MEVRAHVAAGDLGNDFVELLRRTARSLTKAKPPPSGGTSWSDEEVDDLAFDMVNRVTPAKIVLAANHAANDAEFAGYIKSALRTQLQLRGRETPRGWVIARIDEALADDPTFVREADRWALAGHNPADGRNEDLHELTKAASAVETRTIRQNPDANKLQIAWRDDMRAVCTSVLRVAGSLSKAALADIVAQRFNVSSAGNAVYLDLDTPRDDADDHVPAAIIVQDWSQAELENDDAARWMLTQFTEEELVELRAAIQGGGSLRGIGQAMGHGKHKADALKARVAEKLRRLGEEAGDDDLQATARLLRMVGQAAEILDLGEEDGNASE